jgi:hypothetical protein
LDACRFSEVGEAASSIESFEELNRVQVILLVGWVKVLRTGRDGIVVLSVRRGYS